MFNVSYLIYKYRISSVSLKINTYSMQYICETWAVVDLCAKSRSCRGEGGSFDIVELAAV